MLPRPWRVQCCPHRNHFASDCSSGGSAAAHPLRSHAASHAILLGHITPTYALLGDAHPLLLCGMMSKQPQTGRLMTFNRCVPRCVSLPGSASTPQRVSALVLTDRLRAPAYLNAAGRLSGTSLSLLCQQPPTTRLSQTYRQYTKGAFIASESPFSPSAPAAAPVAGLLLIHFPATATPSLSARFQHLELPVRAHRRERLEPLEPPSPGDRGPGSPVCITAHCTTAALDPSVRHPSAAQCRQLRPPGPPRCFGWACCVTCPA